MRSVEDFLEHHGVKGMKWGVHRARTPQVVAVKTRPGKRVKASGGKHQAPSEDAIKAAVTRQKARKSTTDSLSNQELQALVQRMNLEQQYSNLSSNRAGVGRQVVRALLGQVGDKQINDIGNFAATKSGKPAAGVAARAGVGIAKSVAGGGGGGKKKK